MKRLSRILMFFGLVTLTAIALVWFRLDAIAQTSLEENLTKVLGVSTQISSLSINKFSGSAQIKDLTIENPQGFSDGDIFQVREIDVGFTPLSLFGQTLEVQSLQLEQIGVNFEQRLRDNNILEIVNHVKSRQKRRSTHFNLVPNRPRIVSSQISFKDKRFEIETVNLNDINAQVSFSPLGDLIPFGGLSKSLDVSIPDIELRNVNSENAQFVLEGTLDDVVFGLVGDLAGDIFQEVPQQMDSDDAKGIIGDLLKELPF